MGILMAIYSSRSSKLVTMSVISTFLFVTAIAQTGTPKISVRYDKYVLPNGMKVILHVDKTLPIATINTWFYVGSKDEPERRSGFAHLFEHLMFMGSKRVGIGQFDSIMEAAGGQNNASTAEDRTNYYSFGPANLLPTLLWLDADRLEGLAQAMDLKKLDLQRDVVKNERRQNVENQPYGKAYEAINGLMFPKGHPYSTSVIGSHEDLTAASVQDVQDFFNRFYVPNNASLVIAGDFDPDVIRPLVAKLFGTLPRQNDVARKDVVPFVFRSKKLTMIDAVSASKSIMVYHTPATSKPGDFAMQVAAQVLSNGLSSRLQKKVVQELGLASEISASQSSMYLSSLFYVDATVTSGKSQAAMNTAILSVLKEFSKTGPTKAELGKVVAQFESRIANQLQSVDQKADLMNEFEFYYGNPDSFQRVIDDMRKVTSQEVALAVKKYLVDAESLLIEVLPSNEQEGANPRDTQPKIAESEKFVSPKPIQFELSVGVPVQFWQRAGVPLVEVLASYPLGSMSDPKGKEGLMRFTVELMSRAGNKMMADQFSNEVDALGASISGGTDQRELSFGMSSPLSNFEAVSVLFSGILSAPTLSKDDFDILKDERLAALEQENDSPGRVAQKVLAREYFGVGSDYARFASMASVKSFTLEEVKALATKILAQTPRIYCASGASESVVKPVLMRALGGVVKSSKVAPAKPIIQAPMHSGARLLIVDRPKAVQTVISIAFPALPANDADRVQLDALSTVLGGSFTSRLNSNLREDKGYTYGAGSDVNGDQYLGWLTLSSSVRADVTGLSMVEFLKEIERVEKGDFSAVEVGKANQIMRTGAVSQFSSLAGIIGTANSANLFGNDLNKVDRDLAAFSKLTVEGLNAIGKRIVNQNRALFVLVGDKSEILKQLEGLKLPKPEIVTP
jgi:zinc protease